MSKIGRPSKLTPEIQEKIVSVIRKGNYIETAAAFAGISKQTLYTWMKKGARQEGEGEEFELYQAFYQAVEQALAESEIADLERIEKAAKDGYWQASAWRLERRFPKRWGRQDYTDIVMKETKREPQAKRKVVLDWGRAGRRDDDQ